MGVVVGEAAVGIRVLIAVRHPLVGEALQSILELNRFNVAGRASSAPDAIAQAESLHPEVILLDSQLLSGIGENVIHHLLRANSDVKVIIFADSTEDGEPASRVPDGVAGLIYKDTSADSLLSYLRTIVVGMGKEPAFDVEEAKPVAIPVSLPRWFAAASAFLLASILFVLNVLAISPLFQGGYTQYLGSIESAFITDARFIVENGLFATWNPLWYLGFPFHLFYTPVLPYLAAKAYAIWPDHSIPSWYRMVSALFYAFGPVTLFLFTRYLTRRTLTALICALGYSILPSAVYLIPELRNDASTFSLAPWQLVVMAKYGEGPHIASLAVTPLAALFFLRALRQPTIGSYVLAGLAIALVALINWIGLFALVVVLAVVVLSEALVGQAFAKLGRAFWCGVIAYGLSAFWYNISFIRASLAFGGSGDILSRAPHIIIAGTILVYILFIRLSNKPKIQAEIVVGLWVLFFGAIVLGGQFFDIRLAPQPIRYTPELSMGAALAMALVLTGIHDRLCARLTDRFRMMVTPVFFVAVVVGFALASQPFLRNGSTALLPNADFQSSSEYRVAQWLAANGGGEQAYVTGSHAFWLNVESNVPQVRGGTDQGATNRWWAHVSYQINTGEDSEISLLWLRAMGIRWLVVNYPESTDAYKDYAYPHKFDALLTRRFLEQGTAIFEVPLAKPGLVQTVVAKQMGEIAPIFNAIDKTNLARYVDVVESPQNSGTIRYRRPSPNRVEIDAETKEGEALLIRSTFDAGWQAYVDGKQVPITSDVLGFILLEVPTPGFHQVRLEHTRTLDVILGYLVTVLTVLGLFGYVVRSRGRPLVDWRTLNLDVRSLVPRSDASVRRPSINWPGLRTTRPEGWPFGSPGWRFPRLSADGLTVSGFATSFARLVRVIGGSLANLLALTICLAAYSPLASMFLRIYPPVGIDFFHGAFNLAFLRQHPGLWVSLWNYSWFAGDPFARAYGVLSTYLGVPFALLFGEGPGLLYFLVSAQTLFVVFTYFLLKELSGRYIVTICLTILVAWSGGVYYALSFEGTTGQTSAQMFLPLCLFILVKYLRTGNQRLLVAAALLNGLAFLTHPIVGSLTAALMGVILLSAGDGRGRFLSAVSARRLLIYGSLMAAVGGVVGVPLFLTNIQYSRRVASEGTVPDYIGAQAPIEIFLSANPAILAVLFGMICWRIYDNRRNPAPSRFPREVFMLAVAAILLVLGQFIFATNLNPAPTSLGATRTWFLAPVIFSGLAASLARKSGARGDSIGGQSSVNGLRQRLRVPLTASVALLGIALIGPIAGWPRIESNIIKTWLHPMIVIDAMMRRDDLANKPITPPWLDVNATDVRAWIQDPRITIWWGALHQMPMTGGYFDPAYRPWMDWRNWMQMAINGSLANQARYTPDAAKNVARFAIDWYALRYLISSPGGEEDTYPAPYLLTPEIVQESAFVNGMQTIAVRPELSDPIVSATNAPTVLVVGDDRGYDTIVRAIALANLGSRRVITIRGPKRIDDVSPEEISRFSGVILYNYDYSDAGRAFGMLEQYVRRGGGLFIETGSVVRDSESANLPSPFPLGRLKRGPLGMQWILATPKSKALGGLDASTFSPPMYENGPWALSYGPEASDVKPWAEVVLGQIGHPIMVSGDLEKGRVVWSGMNLPYHVGSYVNLSEASLLADIVRWIAPQEVEATPEYRVQRPSPESVTLTGNGFKGVLFKENGFGGWGAKVLKGQSSTDVKIYRAGPDFMYVGIPANDRANQVAVQFNYSGQGQDWALLGISLLTILFTVDYVLFGGWIVLRRLAKAVGPLSQPARRISESVSKRVIGDEEE